MSRLNSFNPWALHQKQNEIFDAIERRFFPEFRDPFSTLDSIREYESPAELYRSDDTFILLVPVPGFTKSEIKIKASKNHIVINCTKKEKEDNKDAGKFKLIRGTVLNSLSYREPIPGTINPSSITANVVDGVLHIQLSVAPKKEQDVEIEIE